jgi:hypothetical protein
MNCSQCTNEATRFVTNDMDIQGIPLCDDPDCYTKVLVQLWEYADSFDNDPGID